MRFLYHHRTRRRDGQSVHVRALRRAFVEAGHELQEVALQPVGAPASGSKRSWSWVTRLPRPGLEIAEYSYSWWSRRAVLSAARSFRPEFLYERYAFGNVGGALAARRLGLPYVVEVNSPVIEEIEQHRGLMLKGIARRIERTVLSTADLVCTVSEALGDLVVDRGVERSRLLITPNGVSEEVLSERETADRAEVLEKLGVPEPVRSSRCLVGFIGFPRSWHRLDVALHALLDSGLDTVSLVIVGLGPETAHLKRLVQTQGLEGRVHFAEAVAHGEVADVLGAFDVGLLSGIPPYAAPLKMQEYMAAGLPIVAPDQPNIREIVDDGREGLLFEAGSAESLGRALKELALSPGKRQELGAAGRATIRSRGLTWRRNVELVIERMEAICSAKRAHGAPVEAGSTPGRTAVASTDRP